MKFKVKTEVAGDHRKVYSGFTKSLLQRLVPPGMRLRLDRYDEPTRVGGRVHIHVTILGLIRQQWENVITEVVEGEEACWFVDEGEKLPFPLRYWRHRHVVEAHEGHSRIVDDVEYKAGNLLLTWLMFPVVYLQFVARKPGYRKAFGKP